MLDSDSSTRLESPNRFLRRRWGFGQARRRPGLLGRQETLSANSTYSASGGRVHLAVTITLHPEIS